MNDKIALIDMDGTLCDYDGEMKRQLSLLLNIREQEARDEQYDNVRDLIKRQSGFWRDLKPIDDGFIVLKMLQERGLRPHVLTKGPYNTTSAWTEKVEWCRKHIPNIPVTITENKSLVYGRILFDDWPRYCETWLLNRPRGLVLMLAYDYNKGFDEKYPNQVVRVDNNWDEVEYAIKVAYQRESGAPLFIKRDTK